MGFFWERGYLTDRSEPLDEFLGKSSPWAWKDVRYRYGKEGGKASGARQVPQTARETRSVLLRRHYLYRSFALFFANTNSFVFDTNPLRISEFGDLDRFAWRISASSLELGCYSACFFFCFFRGKFSRNRSCFQLCLTGEGFLSALSCIRPSAFDSLLVLSVFGILSSEAAFVGEKNRVCLKSELWGSFLLWEKGIEDDVLDSEFWVFCVSFFVSQCLAVRDSAGNLVFLGPFYCARYVFLYCLLSAEQVSNGSFFFLLLESERKTEKLSAMAVAYASAYSAAGKQRRPAPRRGQVKAAIAASWLHTLSSIVHGARSVALRHSHSWSFRSNWTKWSDFYR